MHPTRYPAKDGELSGSTLLRMVEQIIQAVVPELTGRTPGRFTGRRDEAVAAHMKDWGPLIATKKGNSALVGAREPTAPALGTTTRSNLQVNAGYWLSHAGGMAPSYPELAKGITTQHLTTAEVRTWLVKGKPGGSDLTKLVGEATFGAEPARNPRSFASHLMVYDLLESGRVPADKESYATSMAELYNMRHSEGTHGALPMMGQETYEHGALGISEGALNTEQRKEAIAISAWLTYLQGRGPAFTKDQVYELLLRRVSTFGDLGSLGGVPSEAEAKGRGDEITAANAEAETAERDARDLADKANRLRLATETVRQEKAALEKAKQVLAGVLSNPPVDERRVTLLSKDLAQLKKRVREAVDWLRKEAGLPERVAKPHVAPRVEPPPQVLPEPEPEQKPETLVVAEPVADVVMTPAVPENRKRRLSEEATSEPLLDRMTVLVREWEWMRKKHADKLARGDPMAVNALKLKEDEIAREKARIAGTSNKKPEALTKFV